MRVADAIEYCRIMVGDEHGDVHTDSKMQLHVNRVLRDISMRSRTITEGLFMPAAIGQARYGLPEGFLQLEIAGWRTQAGRYVPLDPVTMRVASWGVFNGVTGRPRLYDVFGRAAVEKAVEIVERVGVLPIEEGEADSITLVGEPIIQNLKRGDEVINVTDGSSVGKVEYTRNTLKPDNSILQVIAYTELQGGTRPKLQVGDEVRIVSPGTPLQSLIVSPVPTAVGDIGDEALFLFIARAHRHISAQNIEDENDDIELDPEFEETFIEYLTYRMRRDELGLKDPETQAQLVLANGLYQENLPKVKDRIRQWITLWYQQQGLQYQQEYISPTPPVQYAIGSGSDAVA